MSNTQTSINQTMKPMFFSAGKKIVSFITLLVAFTSFASAQQNEYEFIKTQFQSDKKTLLMQYLALPDADAAKFWPIYTEYEKERGEMADKRFANLKTYADTYKTMTDEQADNMINSYWNHNEKVDAIKKKYYSQVKKTLTAKTAASWIQFEEYIDAAVQQELLENVPFIKAK